MSKELNFNKYFTDLIEKWADELFTYRHPPSFAEELEEALAAHKKVAHDWAKEDERQLHKIMELKCKLVDLTEGTDDPIDWDEL